MSGVVGEPQSSLVGRWESVYGRHQGGYLHVQESITADQIGDALDMVRASARVVTAEGGAS